MSHDERLVVALTHLAPRRGHPEANRATFRSALRAAAEAGARLVIGPELAVAGYGFGDRAEAARAAEPMHGPTVRGVLHDCGETGVIAVVGLLEAGPDGRLYNSAVVVGPHGLLAVHRKLVIAERSWAEPGRRNATTVDTPFGRIGVLICADSYYAGPARSSAVAGADLLVVSSAWPAGDLDPVDIWRERARQNGLPLLACNRTGVDGTFDARTGPTAVIDPGGEVRLEYVSDEEHVVLTDVPLTDGRVAQRRDAALADRRTQLWSDAMCSPAMRGRTAHASTRVHVATDPAARFPAGADVVVLPAGRAPARVPNAGLVVGSDERGAWVLDGDNVYREPSGLLTCAAAGRRLGVLTEAQTGHPEAIIGLVRRGCDLVAVPLSRPVDNDVRRLGVLALERAALAVAAPGRAVLAIPPTACEAATVHATSAASGIDAEVTVPDWGTTPPAVGLDRAAS